MPNCSHVASLIMNDPNINYLLAATNYDSIFIDCGALNVNNNVASLVEIYGAIVMSS